MLVVWFLFFFRFWVQLLRFFLFINRGLLFMLYFKIIFGVQWFLVYFQDYFSWFVVVLRFLDCFQGLWIGWGILVFFRGQGFLVWFYMCYYICFWLEGYCLVFFGQKLFLFCFRKQCLEIWFRVVVGILWILKIFIDLCMVVLFLNCQKVLWLGLGFFSMCKDNYFRFQFEVV